MEEFFANDTVESVLSNHANEISKLEDSELKRVLALYKKARHDVRDRLDAIPSGTFTAQKYAGTLAQIEAGISKMNEMLTGQMNLVGRSGAELGAEHLIEEINRFNRVFAGAIVPINVNAVRIASDASNFLFNKYETSIEAYSGQLR